MISRLQSGGVLRRRTAWPLGVATLGVGLAIQTGCTKVPLLAPSSSTITLVAGTNVLPINGSTQIVANVIESSGTAVQDGTVVTFIPTLGTVKPTDAATVNGKATAQFLAGAQSGEATITAISGGAKVDAEAALKIKIGGAAAGSVRLTATPTTLPSTGGTSELIAVVSDVNANRLPGVPVSFSTNAGALSTASATTDQNGEARTSLMTNRETIVTAHVAGSGDAALTAVVTIGINASPAVGIATTTTNPVAGLPVVFTVTPGTGVTLRNVTVNFGDGGSVDLGAIAATTTVSHTYGGGGTFTVSATATDTSGESATTATVVTVLPRAPLNVSVTATPNPVTVGEVVSFTGTPAPGGTPAIATYAWDFGDGVTTTTTGNTVGHQYSIPPMQDFVVRTVTLVVTAVDGSSGTGQVSVTVNIIPIAAFLVTPASPQVNVAATFDASTSKGNNLSYSWSFGDGSTGTGQVAVHTYTSTGPKTVTLTVTDTAGKVRATSQNITVIP